VENKALVDKIIACKPEVYKINKIIQYIGNVEESHNGLVISWEEFMGLHKETTDDQLQQRINQICPDKCATLIYTVN
jgi:long-subunit acyl-CoA synthetase (AMP-forming)